MTDQNDLDALRAEFKAKQAEEGNDAMVYLRWLEAEAIAARKKATALKDRLDQPCKACDS